MDAAARRGKPNRGRPLVPPNYVSLRDLQELRMKEKEEQQRREEEEAEARRVREEQRKRQEEEEAAARKVREEQRKRQEEEEAAARKVREEQRKRQEEEEAAARRFIEERRRRAEEAAARRARDAAAAPRPEMRASSSSHASSFRSNERARGGQRLVAVADRPPPPPPPRGGCAAVKIDGATGGCRGQKGTDDGAANAPLPQNVGRGKVSAGIAACPGEPTKPAAASSGAGKPEEKKKVEDSACQEKSLLGAMPTRTSNASGEPAKVDIASYRGPARPNYRHQQKKGLDGRSTETAMTSLIAETVEASPLPIVNLENKGKSRSGDRDNETASANMPGKAAEASPAQGIKSDNKGKKKPSGGRQASVPPSSDLRDGKKVDTLGCEGTVSAVSSAPSDQADAGSASYGTPLRPMYRHKGKKGLYRRSTEKATAIVASKATDASPLIGVNLEITGKNGLIDQGTEIALARLPGEAADASLARGFKSEKKEKKEPSAGRHAGMAPSTDRPDGMKTQPCLAAEGNGSQRSSGVQVATWEAKTKGLQGKQTVVEVKAQQHPAAENISYSRSGGDEGVIQAAKSEGSVEKQSVVEMRTAAQLKSCDIWNSGRQRSGVYSRVNVNARQHGMVWVPKAAAVPESVEVGKFP